MPQLNPEFYISQLFWLVISFTFLFIFLWRISLPRISTVLEKRSNKINEDIEIAKLHFRLKLRRYKRILIINCVKPSLKRQI